MGQEASQSSAIEVRGLTKSFGDRLALKGVSLTIARGESVVIFGPNGAGKTTLVKVLATILKPTSGRVLINALEVKSSAEAIRRHIGVVTHQTFLYGNLTAYENLDFYARMFDVPRRRERVQEVAALVGMTSRLHDRVSTLSRGMQQRISIARALLHKPGIMLLDEAETGLDPQATGLLWSAMRTGENGEPRTIILTTHNLERGFALCDRLLIMGQGKILYEASRQVLDLTGLIEAYQHCTGVRI
ncbi:MAG: ABC transporter ATP-binding protein [Chloroflexi bacterium]|nr:ABC transporter ATP-binding protein [Chloroflexota bacterium]